MDNRNRFRRLLLLSMVVLMGAVASVAHADDGAIELGARRELLVDRHLIGRMENVDLVLNQPRDEGAVVRFDQPWEGRFCGYSTVIHDGEIYRLYYRGIPEAGSDGNENEVTCYAESKDGIHWTKPNLGLFEVQGTRENNVILAQAAPVTHNFCPFLDRNPNTKPEQRFKAIGGTSRSGLIAYVSADGIRWEKLQDEPIFKDEGWVFDSQNLVFWSESEQAYVLYYRKAPERVRAIARAMSPDFINWSAPQMMEYDDVGGSKPSHHLYTSQTQPYFRAPHIYIATAARFMPGRQVITDKQAEAINVHPRYFKDTSDAVLMTSRGGNLYHRTFLEGFLRPGVGLGNWVSRTNYPALNVVQTGPDEMSLYVNQDYGQLTSHLRRYSLRLDGFASARASYAGGELVTKPLTFSGRQLMLNFATSAAGGIRVEIQTAEGSPIAGYTADDAVELIGNEIERAVSWKNNPDLSELAGKPVRLRLVMKDADVYAFRFAAE